MQKEITDDLEALLDVLPPHIREPLANRDDRHELLEVVMDLGRLPEARYPGREVLLAALARLSSQGVLLTLVPEYEEPLARLLKRMGFERQDQYVVMAKRTAALVRTPRLATHPQTP